MVSARERFVEALKHLLLPPEETKACRISAARTVIEAFADALCSSGGDEATCCLATDGTAEEHARCRALILKECGL